MREHDRGIGFQFAIVILFLIVVSLIIVMLVGPMEQLTDFAYENNQGSEYETAADGMTDRVWMAFTSLPLIALILALVYVIAIAILHSSGA